jgi:predicted short-subunit dehydrogenase-like oxidoreductase (DUF2520 family)
MKPSFSIIGCGRVGTVLARELAAAGYPPAGFASRSRQSAEQAAAAAGRPDAVFDAAWEAAHAGSLVFLTTPDQAISSTCRQIAENEGFGKGAVVLHCSGALSSGILSAAAEGGAHTGSMHPLQSFAAAGGENPFSGIKAAVEGDAAAVEAARQAALDLGAEPISIRTEGKTLYHAAAVVASNYLVTLMGLSFELLEKAGVSRSEAFDVLKPLVRGTLNNIENVGIPDALTGPIARGDADTVADHLEAMGRESQEVLDIYRRLGLETVDIALEKGGISKADAEKLRNLLE